MSSRRVLIGETCDAGRRGLGCGSEVRLYRLDKAFQREPLDLHARYSCRIEGIVQALGVAGESPVDRAADATCGRNVAGPIWIRKQIHRTAGQRGQRSAALRDLA